MLIGKELIHQLAELSGLPTPIISKKLETLLIEKGVDLNHVDIGTIRDLVYELLLQTFDDLSQYSEL